MIEYNKNNLLVILGNQLFPLEYISQLNINKVFMKEESSDLTRTQVIEFYRSNMSSNFQDKPNN